MTRQSERSNQHATHPGGQMNASISGRNGAPSASATAGFGRIGIPAVAAAAEMMRTKKPADKPIHALFYLGSD